MKTILILLLLFNFLITFHGQSQESSLYEKVKEIKLNKVQQKELLVFEKEHKKKAETEDDKYNLALFAIPSNIYKINSNYLAKYVIRGTSISNSCFYYHNGEKWTEKNYDFFALDSVEQLKNSSFLKLYFHAGCCDFRYNAIALVICADSLEQVFLLPQRVQSSPGYSPRVYSPDLKFTLLGDFKTILNKQGQVKAVWVDYYYKSWNHPEKNKRPSNYNIRNIQKDYDKKMSIRFTINNLEVENISVDDADNQSFLNKLLKETNNLQKVHVVRLVKLFKEWMKA